MRPSNDQLMTSSRNALGDPPHCRSTLRLFAIVLAAFRGARGLDKA